MVENNVRKWVAALRSGQYQQGREFLRSNDKFCCWGVACEISGLGKWSVPTQPQSVQAFDAGNLVPMIGNPPVKVIDWVGEEFEQSIVFSRLQEFDLIALNDCEEFTFDQIADVIEAKLNG